MIYLDTSALIKLYFHEAGSEQVQELLMSQDDSLPVWELQEMELSNAFRLKVFWKDITEEDADQQWSLFQRRKAQGQYFFPELDRVALLAEFHALSRHTQDIGCRSLDILHVACAAQLSAEIFLSFDQRQCTLAKKVGLNLAI